MVDMAQLASAPDCGSGGQGFDSLYPPHFNKYGHTAHAVRPLSFIEVSPSGKARDFDSRIRRFESCHLSQSRTSTRKFRVEVLLFYFPTSYLRLVMNTRIKYKAVLSPSFLSSNVSLATS